MLSSSIYSRQFSGSRSIFLVGSLIILRDYTASRSKHTYNTVTVAKSAAGVSIVRKITYRASDPGSILSCDVHIASEHSQGLRGKDLRLSDAWSCRSGRSICTECSWTYHRIASWRAGRIRRQAEMHGIFHLILPTNCPSNTHSMHLTTTESIAGMQALENASVQKMLVLLEVLKMLLPSPNHKLATRLFALKYVTYRLSKYVWQ